MTQQSHPERNEGSRPNGRADKLRDFSAHGLGMTLFCFACAE